MKYGKICFLHLDSMQTKTLEEERDYYQRNFEESQQEVQQLKAMYQNLLSENEELKSYCFPSHRVSALLAHFTLCSV